MYPLLAELFKQVKQVPAAEPTCTINWDACLLTALTLQACSDGEISGALWIEQPDKLFMSAIESRTCDLPTLLSTVPSS